MLEPKLEPICVFSVVKHTTEKPFRYFGNGKNETKSVVSVAMLVQSNFCNRFYFSMLLSRLIRLLAFFGFSVLKIGCKQKKTTNLVDFGSDFGSGISLYKR